ncbi:hypothetical protein GQ53DRAFT_828179 [Thozetella sp. PMI_491]|nr:hypothetical protein GQ53DRAFT_828179 [Thozetella sp. PMI_491]
MKRQSGYQPTATACSEGATCADSCGPGYITCDDSNNPSPEFSLYCYDPNIGETCCSDLTGSSCASGFYCTKDTSGNDWCCPDGSTLAECQAQYSISGSLVSIAPLTYTPTNSSGPTATATTQATTSAPIVSSATPSTSSVASGPGSVAGPSSGSGSGPGSNVTFTSTVTAAKTATTSVVTAAANNQALPGGLAVFAVGVAGLMWAI